ncbi:MAG: pilus assembly protein [Elusimicrobiaceae bacterium]|nr:pilus assembly protein [Elusimicrobiaceae bacterium]
MKHFSFFQSTRGQATTEVVLLFPLFVIFALFLIKLTGLLVLNQKMQIAAVYAARRFQLQSHETAFYANGWDKRYLMPRIEEKVKEYVGFNNEGMRKFLSLRDLKVKIDPSTTWTKVTIIAYMKPMRIRFLCNYNKDTLCQGDTHCLHGYTVICETGGEIKVYKHAGHNERPNPYERPEGV